MKKVVTIGGGTGSFTVLSGLKKYPFDLSAIVTVMDDGGSSGVLRDEYGVLPPGDMRQCLVALSEGAELMRDLFNYRYDRGELQGHNFGNIFISTLEQLTGSIDKALDVAAEVLKIRGRVIPVTAEKIHLVTELHNGKVLQGEHELTTYQLVSRFGIKEMRIEPHAEINPKARDAIASADIVLVCPGNFYSSIVPNFLVSGMSEALRQSKAKKIFSANLMNRHGHTDDFTVTDYVTKLEEMLGQPNVFDTVIYNTKAPDPELVRKYADEGEPTSYVPDAQSTKRYIGEDLIADGIAQTAKKDMLRRTLIRHDPEKLARVIAKIAEEV